MRALPPRIPTNRSSAHQALSATAANESSEPAGGRVALVSGGNRGLGLQIVRRLAGQGMRVVLASRSPEDGRAAVEMLGSLADRVAVRQLDLTNALSVHRLASWLRHSLGRCDVLVNNAAVLLDEDHYASTVDLDLVERTLQTNLLGTWRLTRAIVPLMRTHRYGRVVNISSRLASLASMGGGLPAYRVSKCAVNALTRILAGELAGDGILVNACCPAPAHLEGGFHREATSLYTLADTPVWLASLSDDGPTGGFYGEREPIDW